MPRPRKVDVQTVLSPPPPSADLERASSATAEALPPVSWLSLVKGPGGYVVMRATTVGRDVQGLEVLAGPMNRTGASAALRVEMARQFLMGKGVR